jgi:hypothetical protein
MSTLLDTLSKRVSALSPSKQRTLVTVLENLEGGRDDDLLLEQEIAEFQAAGRPLDSDEKERLRQKYEHV